MRKGSIENRSSFLKGALFGLVLVVVKLLIVLPVDIADATYGIALLITIVITAGEIMGLSLFVLEAKGFDFVLGFLFPLDCYAVLILFEVPLPN